MFDSEKYVIVVMEGKHEVKFADSIKEAALFIKQNSHSINAISAYKEVQTVLNGKDYKQYSDKFVGVRTRISLSSRANILIGKRFRVKKVLRNLQRLRDVPELQLWEKWKKAEGHKFQQILFGEFERRYTPKILTEAKKLFDKIDKNLFSMDWEDCIYEARYCLHLALNYFDINKVSDKFNKDSFSIGYYMEQQMRARISSYTDKVTKRRNKFSVHSFPMDFSAPRSDEDNSSNNEKYLLDERYSPEQEIDKIDYKSIDKFISDEARKIKELLMAGKKESKIKQELGLKEKQFQGFKLEIKGVMIKLGLNVAY